MEDKILAKLEELAKTKENLVAQLNAVMGAEQTLKSLLEGENNENNTD